MTISPVPTNGQPDEQPRDAAYWSGQVSGLKVSNVPSGALNLNVDGKLVNGPLQGFGQMWQKTYRITLNGAPLWRIRAPLYWRPAGMEFLARQPQPIDVSLGGVRIYSDDPLKIGELLKM